MLAKKELLNLNYFLKMANETTRIFVPEGNNDALTAAMMNGGGFGGAMNNPFWALIFLAAFTNGGFFGNNRGNQCAQDLQLQAIREQLTSNQNSTLLMDAIKGNSGAISSLATNLNLSKDAVTAAINGVQQQICNLGSQNGMNFMQVINSIQAGNTALANQIAQCCCDSKQLVLTQGYENRINNMQQSQLIQNGFCEVGYAASQNANSIKQAISDQTLAVIGKIDAQESARKDREINALTAQLATVNARAERAAELAPIYKALGDIQAKQPSTVSVPYPQLTAIPNYMLYSNVAAGAGVFGLGNNGGIFG